MEKLNINPGWFNVFEQEFNKKYFAKISNLWGNSYDDTKYDEVNIFPKKNNIFRAFKYFDPKDTKVVLLGQDPYIGYQDVENGFIPQAMGLSFSISKRIKNVPPSLINIFKELKNNYPNFKIPNNGNLKRWAKKENILLLNSALTVKKGESGSHLKIWEPFTDAIINYISENNQNVVFLLLGSFAKSKSILIDSKKHKIITAVHPSPLSAYRGFFGSNIFKKVDEYLIQHNKRPINWNLIKKRKKINKKDNSLISI